MRKKKAEGGRHYFVYIVAIVAAIGGMLFGYDIGVISGAILFIQRDFNLSYTMKEFVVSAVLIGSVIGAIVGGWLTDRFGRRSVIIWAAAVFGGGAVFTAISWDEFWLIVGRIVVGWAIGVASLAVPLYISEIAPKRARGWMVSLNQLAVTIGILISYGVDYAFSGSGDWRWMLALAVVPAAVLLFGMLPMPKSPRWLVGHGRKEEAEKVLRRVRGKADVSQEINSVQSVIAKQQAGWRELLHPDVRMALVVGLGLAIYQQITGINTVVYYAPTIFQFAGYASAGQSILATVFVGAVNMGMTIMAMILVDRWGRRPLVLWGLGGMIVFLGVLGVSFAEPTLLKQYGWLPVVSLMGYVGSFAIGLGPVFWLLISEIYPLRVRGTAMGIATVANWGANLVVAITFLTLVNAVGKDWTFWIYAIIGVTGWIFCFSLVPETKDKSLEQIEAQWQHGSSDGN